MAPSARGKALQRQRPDGDGARIRREQRACDGAVRRNRRPAARRAPRPDERQPPALAGRQPRGTAAERSRCAARPSAQSISETAVEDALAERQRRRLGRPPQALAGLAAEHHLLAAAPRSGAGQAGGEVLAGGKARGDAGPARRRGRRGQRSGRAERPARRAARRDLVVRCGQQRSRRGELAGKALADMPRARATAPAPRRPAARSPRAPASRRRASGAGEARVVVGGIVDPGLADASAAARAGRRGDAPAAGAAGRRRGPRARPARATRRAATARWRPPRRIASASDQVVGGVAHQDHAAPLGAAPPRPAARGARRGRRPAGRWPASSPPRQACDARRPGAAARSAAKRLQPALAGLRPWSTVSATSRRPARSAQALARCSSASESPPPESATRDRRGGRDRSAGARTRRERRAARGGVSPPRTPPGPAAVGRRRAPPRRPSGSGVSISPSTPQASRRLLHADHGPGEVERRVRRPGGLPAIAARRRGRWPRRRRRRSRFSMHLAEEVVRLHAARRVAEAGRR